MKALAIRQPYAWLVVHGVIDLSLITIPSLYNPARFAILLPSLSLGIIAV
ncbi:MAG: hypothetical protein RRC07_17535 [Anaerolineae bacterium]|nr:hypothetical protein [Anaerolineae bacterium]